jgi:hypothetical protein
VSVPVADLVAFEVLYVVETLPGFGVIAGVRHGPVITVVGMESVIDVSMKALGAVKPRTGSNEDAA